MKKNTSNKEQQTQSEKTDIKKEVPLKIKTSFSKAMRVLSTPKK